MHVALKFMGLRSLSCFIFGCIGPANVNIACNITRKDLVGLIMLSKVIGVD